MKRGRGAVREEWIMGCERGQQNRSRKVQMRNTATREKEKTLRNEGVTERVIDGGESVFSSCQSLTTGFQRVHSAAQD